MKRPWARVRDLLIDPNGPPLDAMAVLGGQARSAAAMLSQAAEETVGGIMAKRLGHTKFLDSRGMREMLSGSDFSALDLNKGNTTVYFVLPPEYLGVHAAGAAAGRQYVPRGRCEGPQGQASDALHSR